MAAGNHLPYIAQLKRWDDEEAMLAAKQVHALTEHPGWAQLQRLLDEVHGNAFDRLLGAHAGSDGKVFDQAEYTRLIGFLAGLRESQTAAQGFSEFAERERAKNREAVPTNAP